MKLVDRVLKRFGYGKIVKRSGFQAAQLSRLTNDWTVSNLSPDAEIWKDLKVLRARARDLERSNDYLRKFLGDAEKNILGASGIGLQMKIKDPDGSYDDFANNMIEDAWFDFCKRKTFTVTRKMGALTACRLILRSILRDGECIIRKVQGFKNDWGFAIQLIEADLLDIDLNENKRGQNKIKMGVELNQWDEPVAYHLLQGHPGDVFSNGTELFKNRMRVPADQILHPFVPDRIGQTRGYPWMVSTLLRTQMLAGYEESVVVGARSAAATMGFIERETPEGWNGESDGNGNIIQEIEPGLIVDLPMGMQYKPHLPGQPSAEYAEFRKGVLRGIASGLGVSYNALSGDYESVNYSSLRAAALDDRELWKMLQAFFIETVMQEIFEPWLEMALLTQKVPLPSRKLAKFNSPEWKPRRWAWVDPLKDVQAAILEVDHGFDSPGNIIAEDGGDIEDIYDGIAQAQALAEEKGIELGADKEAAAQASIITAKEDAAPAGKGEDA